MTEDQRPTFSTEDYLMALGKAVQLIRADVKSIRSGVNIVAVLALVQLVLLGLWLLGAITVQFET